MFGVFVVGVDAEGDIFEGEVAVLGDGDEGGESLRLHEIVKDIIMVEEGK